MGGERGAKYEEGPEARRERRGGELAKAEGEADERRVAGGAHPQERNVATAQAGNLRKAERDADAGDGTA